LSIFSVYGFRPENKLLDKFFICSPAFTAPAGTSVAIKATHARVLTHYFLSKVESMKNQLDSQYKLYINGQWVDAGDGQTFEAHCPADGSLLSTCANATKEDVDAAVDAAWGAYDSWKDVSAQERAGYLLKIADLIDANAEKLAMVETLDNGKPIRETRNVDVRWPVTISATLPRPSAPRKVRRP
jgi:delta 1-pyrroline-5-carboxylate dehydrogenase